MTEFIKNASHWKLFSFLSQFVLIVAFCWNVYHDHATIGEWLIIVGLTANHSLLYVVELIWGKNQIQK